ncbi:serine hydrolase domain-containing protein [Paenibacillus thalictri]|uniref:Class C beta-lactamase-related serine hydrolase n=1 Tax=Paenibacillus thalictri TaxID=2527873 RepID=A0A4Q9DND8_9BACL|nr:serine hydrolase [Paenibacillus thalictri]TBL76384.1 class C beta-lactamase-related serine hydrolase [Paenibacillus thalictri]
MKKIHSLARTSPEEQGVSSDAVLAFLQAAEREKLGLHGFMLLRHGAVIAEGWWEPYASHRPHMLFSLTKSFTSTAVGFGVDEGLLSVDDSVVSFFPEAVPDKVDGRLAAMRVKDLLTMSVGHAKPIMGSEWRQTSGDWAGYFLEKPMDHEPGTKFMYNSGATYMLSAIMQRVTGQRLLDYLRPRLFAPLGIEAAAWDTCPSGVNTGGWGLSLTTEDLARFGLLYLQRGVWNGKRILSEQWIDEATSRQIDSGDKGQSDSQMGYGYQFWRGRHGTYRADGAFGQFCIVMPEQKAVIAIYGGLQKMQAVLDLLWTHLLPDMRRDTLPKDDVGHRRLADKLKSLQLANKNGTAKSAESAASIASINGLRYQMEENADHVSEIAFNFDDNGCTFTLTDHRGEHAVRCGIGAWVEGSTSMTGNELHHQYQPARMKVAACGVWEDESTFAMMWCFAETPFIDRVICLFSGSAVSLKRSVNVNSTAMERPEIYGTAVIGEER